MDYADRHVVITGGTGALGTAVTTALLEAGAHCHIPCLGEAGIAHFPHRGHARVRLVATGDLSDEGAVAGLYRGIERLWASIHIAGGFAAGPITATSKAAALAQIEQNYLTCFLCCRAAAQAMLAQGGGGRIVNVAARPALEWRLGANMAAYAASKAAVAALTVALGEELAGAGILVNAVAPSIMDTPANRASMPKADHAAWPKVTEVAGTILYLAAPGNRVARGAVVPVYGRS